MDEISVEDVIAVLNDVKEDVDYASEDALVDNRILDSFDVLTLIGALNEEFDISIPAKAILPKNFNSAQAICDLINSLQEED